MDGLMDWGDQGPPDVLPTGYGESVPDRGGPNFPSGFNVPGTGGPGPGWMTAGVGAPEYLGKTDEEKKKLLQWQPRTIAPSEATGGWGYRQHPNGEIDVTAVPPGHEKWIGKRFTQSGPYAKNWAAVTQAIGPWQPPILTGLMQAVSTIASGASAASAARYKPSKHSNKKPTTAMMPMMAPTPAVPTWMWAVGGVALVGIVGVVWYASRSPSKKGA